MLMKKLYEALKITNCLEFIEKLENKINHIVIEDGKNFSIGQLQRLALEHLFQTIKCLF